MTNSEYSRMKWEKQIVSQKIREEKQKEKMLKNVNWCMVLKDGTVLYHKYDLDKIEKVQSHEIYEIKVTEYRAHQIASQLRNSQQQEVI